MAAIPFRRFLRAERLPISGGMSIEIMNNARERARRAEGMPAGSVRVSSWPLSPAHERPDGRLRMSVQPPPQRPLIRRIVGALSRLVSTVAAGAGLMVLAQYLTTP